MGEPRYVSYVQVLTRHGWWVTLVALLAFVLTFFICKLPSLQRYEGAATVVFPLQKSGLALRRSLGSVDLPIGGVSSALGQMMQSYSATTILESRRITDLVLQAHPELRDKLDKNGDRDLEQIRKVIVKKHLRLDDSNQGALTIRFEWFDAQTAADVSNEYVKQLQFILTDLNVTAATSMTTFIEARINGTADTPGLLGRIEEVEGEIEEYKRVHGILALDPQAEQLIKSQAALQEDLTTSEVELAGSQAELSLIERQGGKLADAAEGYEPAKNIFDLEAIKGNELISIKVEEGGWDAAPLAAALEDPAIAALRRTLVNLESERSEKLLLFTPAHPTIVRLTSDIFQTKRQLAEELVKYNDSAEVEVMVDTLALGARRDAAADMLQDIATQIEAFPEKERGLIALERQRELLEKVYVLMMQEIEQTSLAEAAEDTSFTILDPAIVPSKASSPRRLRNSMGAGLLTFLVGLFWAGAIERKRMSPPSLL